MAQAWLVFVGSGLGGVFRWWLGGLIVHRLGSGFPWGTLFVNVTGSFLIGFFGSLTGPEGRFLTSPGWRQFFLIGICGGYTTFSSFSLQTLSLMEHGHWGRAGGNLGGSVGGCLLAVWLGYLLARALNPAKGQ